MNKRVKPEEVIKDVFLKSYKRAEAFDNLINLFRFKGSASHLLRGHDR